MQVRAYVALSREQGMAARGSVVFNIVPRLVRIVLPYIAAIASHSEIARARETIHAIAIVHGSST